MSDGFLGRWSRRKADARQGRPLSEPPAAPLAPGASAPPVVPATTPSAGARPTPAAPHEPGPTGAAPPAELTLDDAQALTPASDFRPFVARSVAPAVRNAAMKKLFADPHFSVMDRMDVYIDDYNLPDPLPLAQLRELASAKFLKLVDEPAEAEGSGASAEGPSVPAVSPSGGPPGTPSELDTPSEPATQAPDHAHVDLRLQPDPAASAPGTGRGAG